MPPAPIRFNSRNSPSCSGIAADGSGSVTSNTLGFTTPSSIIYDGENLILTAQTGTTVAYSIPGLTPAATAQLDPGTDWFVFDGRNTWVGSSFGGWMEKR